MNTGIERISIIDPTRLNSEFYFATLLDEGIRCGLLDEGTVGRVKLECFGLLRDRIEQYTRGESSSVTQQRAQALLSSALYTVGIALKGMPTPEDALAALAYGGKLTELYHTGYERISTKLKTARLYYANVVHSMVVTDNYAYNSTIIGGIRGFFKLYNPRFGADEIHITADYPTANPVTNLVGIEFIQRYLEAIRLENDFCSRFSPQAIEHLLHCYDPGSSDLIFNIFMQVLAGAIACVLAGKEPQTLQITDDDAAKLRGRLCGLPRKELVAVASEAAERISRKLELTSSLLNDYIYAALPELCADISIGLGAGRGFIVTA